MAVKIYRFELLNEVGRSGANVIYDVKDNADNSQARLYEWTPLPEKVAEASATFSELAPQMNGLETFTVGPRLYLVDSQSQARQKMELLRSHGLFPGNWPTLFDAPTLPSDSVNTEKHSTQSSVPQKNRGSVWATLFFTACACVLVLFIWIFSLLGENDHIKNDREKTKAEGQTMFGQLDTLKQNLEAARSELNRQRDFLAKHQDSEGDMASAAFHLAEENVKPLSGYYELSLENQCSIGSLFVAARYLDLEGRWVTRGWWRVLPGQSLTPDLYSKDGVIYIFAENNGRRATLSDTNEFESISDEVLQRTFIHQSTETVIDPNKRTVSLIRLHLTPGSFQLKASFPCPA